MKRWLAWLGLLLATAAFGRAVGTIALVYDAAVGRSGSAALKFDGVNDRVAMTGTAGSYPFVQNTLVFTVAGWLKLEGDRSARQAIMLNNVYSAERGFFFAWETYGGGYGTKSLRFAAWKGTSGIPLIDGHCNDNATINDNDWHHVAAVGNGSQITFYVDGQAKTTIYLTAFQGYSTGNSYGDLNLGVFSTGILPLNGSLDDMRIYSRALSAAEIGGLAGSRVRYVYGLDLVSQARNAGTGWTTNYYGYDGLGSVRYLTEASGVVTDTYTYDAFGILIGQTLASGQTVNNYRYTGEQWDPDLGMYYLRARYLNPTTGRFWTADSYEGDPDDPQSLHKYVYANIDPVRGTDPSGHLVEVPLYTETLRKNIEADYYKGVAKNATIAQRQLAGVIIKTLVATSPLVFLPGDRPPSPTEPEDKYPDRVVVFREVDGETYGSPVRFRKPKLSPNVSGCGGPSFPARRSVIG